MAAHDYDATQRCRHCGGDMLYATPGEQCPELEQDPPWNRDQLLAELDRAMRDTTHPRRGQIREQIERRLILDAEIAPRVEAFNDAIELGQGWLRISDAGAVVERMVPGSIVIVSQPHGPNRQELPYRASEPISAGNRVVLNLATETAWRQRPSDGAQMQYLGVAALNIQMHEPVVILFPPTD